MARPRPTSEDSVLAAMLDTAVHCSTCGSADDPVRCGRRACQARVCPDHRLQCVLCDAILCLGCVVRFGAWVGSALVCDACELPEVV
jgi:hypothetical protein